MISVSGSMFSTLKTFFMYCAAAFLNEPPPLSA
jgi:hypothetical protein